MNAKPDIHAPPNMAQPPNVARPPSAVAGRSPALGATGLRSSQTRADPLSNQQKAQAAAIQQAIDALVGVDWSARCAALGLPAPTPDGEILLHLFGQDVRLRPPDWQPLTPAGQNVKLTDRLLALHYLQCPIPIVPTGELISFRDLPGGQFYFGPFSSRTTAPLVARIGNDLDRLRKNLDRFRHEPAPAPADVGARIQAVGRITVTLLYRAGDEEGPPTAEVLFDACLKRVYPAEDAAALASRICLSLL